MQSGAGKLTSLKLDLFLQPGSQQTPGFALSAGAIQRAVADGDVVIAKDGRVATGSRADYVPAREELQLEGDPAVISDPAKGRVEGGKLTYRLADDSIRVEGKPGLQTDSRWRVP
jgi:lipopolysaccharide export system protein LptA